MLLAARGAEGHNIPLRGTDRYTVTLCVCVIPRILQHLRQSGNVCLERNTARNSGPHQPPSGADPCCEFWGETERQTPRLLYSNNLGFLGTARWCVLCPSGPSVYVPLPGAGARKILGITLFCGEDVTLHRFRGKRLRILCIRRNFYTTLVEAKSEGRAGCCAPHPKEEPTLSTTDGTYIKPIRPSEGHGHGHRLALILSHREKYGATKPGCGSKRTVNR